MLELSDLNTNLINEFEMEDVINEFNMLELDENKEIIHIYKRYTINELLRICHFYNLLNEKTKMKKQQIINDLLIFENNDKNKKMVNLRKMFWFYMEELTNNKFMKKYTIW